MSTAHKTNQGSIVVTILFIMLILSTLIFGLMSLSNSVLYRAWGRILLLQAQYAAESGADAAIATLNNTSSSFTGTTSDVTVLSNVLYKATYATTVTTSGSNKVITATGKVYQPATATSPSYTRTIRVTAQQTAGSTSSGLMSTNIISVDSSVKNIYGNSIYLNGYINMTKNTTYLWFSNLTVAGRDTGSANCSIEGAGNLENYPATSKATIDVAYNNCITPPGNTSNANFNVTANDSSIAPIQSLYIPWSAYMDGTYQNSPSGCNDWIGSGTLTIPSTGNTKKTQYPDSGSGVSTSCGTSGNLDLGSNTYNITDNAHVRANFCATTACNPTFDNTSGSIKFVFIEGTINFSTVHTTAGSSPLVFVTYGADPGTHGACPYGDSVYLGKNGSTGSAAPALYFLALNSICLYQTKFDADPALAGIGGKNIFISSNSGNPFDLYLNTGFPLTEIPINYAWKATGYERL